MPRFNPSSSSTRSDSQSGFSLVEILIASGLVALILTAVASAMTLSIKNSAQVNYRIIATALAQDGVEFFIRENAVLSWSNFTNRFPTGTNRYCLASLPDTGAIMQLPSGDCSGGQTIQEAGGVFTREAVVTDNGTDQLEVQVEVTWVDGTRTSSLDVTRVFRKL